MHSDSGRCQSPPSALTDQCRIDNAALQLREECARLVEANHALGHLSFAVGHRDQIGQTMDLHACFEIPQVGQTLHRTLRAGGRQHNSDRVEPVWSREDDLAQVDPTPAILRFGPLERGEVSPSRGARASEFVRHSGWPASSTQYPLDSAIDVDCCQHHLSNAVVVVRIIRRELEVPFDICSR
jgi:hypothetical protein